MLARKRNAVNFQPRAACTKSISRCPACYVGQVDPYGRIVRVSFIGTQNSPKEAQTKRVHTGNASLLSSRSSRFSRRSLLIAILDKALAEDRASNVKACRPHASDRVQHEGDKNPSTSPVAQIFADPARIEALCFRQKS